MKGKKKKRTEVEAFPNEHKRKRTAPKRRTQNHSYFSSSSPGIDGYSKGFSGAESHYQDNGGYTIVHIPVSITVLNIYEKKKYVIAAEEKKLLNTNSQFSCFPRGLRLKAKDACKQIETNNPTPGVLAECPKARPRALRKGRKRKMKRKEEPSDSELPIPKRTHFRGRVRRGLNNCSAITIERGKLDSATFLHYFMHIWSAFSEEKLKLVTYLDPLLFQLYSNEKNRSMVLKWIKEKDVFSKKYVFVPIVMWSHWSLLIFCHLGETHLHSKTNGPCMLLLDSLHAIGPTRLEPLIRRLLFDLYKLEERLESKEQLKKIPLLIPKVPQQTKGEECGFYILYFIELFLQSAPENHNVSEGYPQFMKKDWFTVEEVESFCKSLPPVSSDHGDLGPADSCDSVELIESSCLS